MIIKKYTGIKFTSSNKKHAGIKFTSSYKNGILILNWLVVIKKYTDIKLNSCNKKGQWDYI